MNALTPHTRDPDQQERLRTAPHAIVIGSGFGGLAAAIRLGARGYRVTILERLPEPGGRASVFRQDGFTFDAGPTIVTAPVLLEELWELCGRRLSDDVELRPVDPFYRIRFNDGAQFNYTGDPDLMRAEIARFAPDDVAGYDRFMVASEEIYRVGFEQLGDVPFLHWTDMARIAPALMRLGGWRSVHGLVSKFIRDERLRTVLSFHPLLVGGNPFSASAIYALIAWLERKGGVHFAMGGTGELIRGMAGLIRGQGNTLRCNAEVAEITVENGTATGVRLASSETLRADLVVSNADASFTYRRLIAPQHRRRWTDRKIERARHSMGLVVWYFGTNRQWDDVQHHTILLGPRHRPLLDDIFKHQNLAEDFSLYLHRPTMTDPSLAPPGCDAFYVLSPVPNLQSGTDWAQQAEPYRAAIQAELERTVLPGLGGHIVSSKIMTPADFETRLLSHAGAAFAMEPLLTQSAWFRPHNRSEDVKNLYLVGAGTHPGAGLPGVLCSAKVLDRLIPPVAKAAKTDMVAHA